MLWQSIWVSGRGVQKELDEAKLRFAAAEVLDLKFQFFWTTQLQKFLYCTSSLHLPKKKNPYSSVSCQFCFICMLVIYFILHALLCQEINLISEFELLHIRSNFWAPLPKEYPKGYTLWMIKFEFKLSFHNLSEMIV